ncbi:MAG TPA: DUF4253 domain-containing protein [Polyangiaceae bacterium]|jgi:hypothetical protein
MRKSGEGQACRALVVTAMFFLGCRATQPIRPATPVPAPIFTQPSGFEAAISTAESLLGGKAAILALSDSPDDKIPAGRMFTTTDGLKKVVDLHDRLEAQGAYLFLLDSGMGFKPDRLGLLPTTDKYQVLETMQTNGNHAHTHAEVMAWLHELDRSDPWLLLGASYDFVDGFFVDPVHDPNALAQNVLTFCPDFYYQGIGLDPEKKGVPPLALTEEYFRTERTFHFWWD